ncbi:50S ribosomal protein L25/general stress protein Ctc [Acetobacteraceae bacterium]|nr:50S ribosomal protein L25/general stress protein Ctc [Acetobacteraceae bacterium]
MAEMQKLPVSPREKAGKGAARAVRRAGKVPGVIYGGGREPALFEIDPRIIDKELNRGGWQSRLYEVQLGDRRQPVLMREIQFHPVTDAPLHIDLQRMRPGQKVHVQIPVVVENEEECQGVRAGGVVNLIRHSVEVEVDVEHIPEHFIADIAALEIADNLRWEDLKGIEGITPVGHLEDLVILSIAAPVSEEAEADEEEASEEAPEAETAEG